MKNRNCHMRNQRLRESADVPVEAEYTAPESDPAESRY